MNVVYRKAVPEDTPGCIDLRGKTRENAFSVEELKAIGITPESWQSAIADESLPGYVGLVDGELAGYCFGDRETGEIAVLALLPACEGKGIGKALLSLMVEEFKALGFKRLFLGCSSDPKVRSHGFYRRLGWKPTGEIDAAGDEVLEYRPSQERTVDSFVPPAPGGPLQSEFEALVHDARTTLVSEVGPLLDGIYLYGSVARGTAEAGSSDLDLTLVFRDPLTAQDSATVEAVRKALEARHSEVVKIDFDIGSLAEALAPKNLYSWGYWLKHHCRCIWGNDLAAHFERFKPSRDIALAVNGDFGVVLRSYAERIDQANDPIELQRLQKEASRKLIRATNILRADEDSTWPQTLEDHAWQLLQRHPSVKPQIDFFLSRARSPTASGEAFGHRLRAFVDWMEKGNATR